jgi:signal transduction histidine kinase
MVTPHGLAKGSARRPRQYAVGASERRGRAAATGRLCADIGRLGSADALASHTLERLCQVLALRWARLAVETLPPAATYRWGDCPGGQDAITARTTGWQGDAATMDRAGWRIVPLVATGLTVGRLELGPKRTGGPFSAGDCALVATVAPVLATALQKVWLIDELERQAARLDDREAALEALSAQLMRAQEEERRRLAGDLHDDPLQRAILLLRELREARAIPDARRWQDALEEIVAAMRAICAGLRPRDLEDFGLVAGLEWLADDVRTRADPAIYVIADTGDGTPFDRLPAELELALFRVAQEALNNCVKHARASQVIVTLWRDGAWLRLSVADDGRGFPGVVTRDRASRHLGILGMRERLRPWRGTVTVSPRDGGGTEVAADVPLGGEHD